MIKLCRRTFLQKNIPMTKLPVRSASAAEVREYIAQVLLSRYNADREVAEEAARSWRLGLGAEIHDASLEFFQQVFGAEIGFCLYRGILDDREQAYELSLRGKFVLCTPSPYVIKSMLTL